MNPSAQTDWREDFGLEGRQPPGLFTDREQIGHSTRQAHLLRSAFDVLEVDGVLCADHSPLVFFKVVDDLTPDLVDELHRRFWNHSGASTLVLVTKYRVHVYSSMIRPNPEGAGTPAGHPGEVVVLERIADVLREFIIAVESGEFFHRHAKSFDPDQRVDRDLLENLRNTRNKLGNVTPGVTSDNIGAVLDALLCRLVFTSYLFDRGVIGEQYLNNIGISGVANLRETLAIGRRTEAKTALYRLFGKLSEDFNGDLFSDDLAREAALIDVRHIGILRDFFQGTDVVTGQRAFWPYDFGYIPIETISAIYERFLTADDEQQGAFYSPRFLAEFVLDTALEDLPSLAGKTFLDPACGSGIFLVGLFNRIAEEWKRTHPGASNDRKAAELMHLLRTSLFGYDINKTACRITAFSLYLAYLDQLTPPDIQKLQRKGRALPALVATDEISGNSDHKNIFQRDFFEGNARHPSGASLVVGNPPWGSMATTESHAGKWCKTHKKPLPDKQIARAFMWKAVEHCAPDGRVCFVLPYGVLFHHSTTAIAFQKVWAKEVAVERVINLADLRRLLFERAIHPALIVSYRASDEPKLSRPTEYWTPKADWTVTQAQVVTIAPQDRTRITLGELLEDLDGPDAPQLWKRYFWATPRDRRLIDRLSLHHRLREIVGKPRENKRWVMTEGFQPLGENDDPGQASMISLPSRAFIAATSPALDLFLLPEDCEQLASQEIRVRRKSNKNTQIYSAPHVLVTKGFKRVAFAEFDVSFRHALRGIKGPEADSDLLAFLAAYLRSPLARYYLFHTSSSWGTYRPEVHVDEVLRVPFPLPEQQPDPEQSRAIIREVSRVMAHAARESQDNFIGRSNVLQRAGEQINELVYKYFDVLPMEAVLVSDTLDVIVPSIQPSPRTMPVPTVRPASEEDCEAYRERVCDMLNRWGKQSEYVVRGRVQRSETLGIGVATLEKVKRSKSSGAMDGVSSGLLDVLNRVRTAASGKHPTLNLVRGVMVFDHNRLYVVKPLGRRFWTQTSAMNDADEIAGTILMRSPKESA